MRILYFDCFSGVSGDMTLAALLDLGLPQEKLRQELAKLSLQNYSLEIFPGSRGGIAALGLKVKVGPQKEPPRYFSDIREMIEASSLEQGVKDMSLAIFQRLAEAEAKIHRQKVEEVRFHEVGAVDSIVDIVGTAIGIEYFKPLRILSSELPMGRGFVQCTHGRLPLPAPATLEILKGYPVRDVNVEGELVTPTGAAIVTTLTSGVNPFPAMKIGQVGYGMGKDEFADRPNLLRLVLGEPVGADHADQVAVLEANIDDMNPEFYDYLMDRLFGLGALDVSLSPLLMKKNRPGTLLRVIAEEHQADALSELILRESTTLGVRRYIVGRKKLAREIQEVETKYGRVRVKISGELRFQPEYDDCKRIALEKGVPIQEVYQEAMKMRK
ncbi:MAG: nickel pincer cofactor biosynthesis protein LarC [Deltaproteobacteria bacterium]|nr:nickel pincer cofactor biosynthesis protein LarC [Deltaproteobacteria bacterium]